MAMTVDGRTLLEATQSLSTLWAWLHQVCSGGRSVRGCVALSEPKTEFGSAQIIAPLILSHATSPHARQHGWRPSSGPHMVVGEQTGPSPRVWEHMSLVRRGFQLVGLAPKHTKLDLREPKWP